MSGVTDPGGGEEEEENLYKGKKKLKCVTVLILGFRGGPRNGLDRWIFG